MTVTNLFEGDPKIVITAEGAEIPFPGNGGQPEMEQGVENLAILSLLTRPGWSGNFYFTELSKKYGSEYEEIAEKPITLTNIELLRQATIKSLKNDAFGTVESIISIISSSQRLNVIKISPPGSDINEIVLQKNGLNWLFQAEKGVEG